VANILVVEDDAQLLAMLAEHIRDSGHEVLEARNADEAVALITSGVTRVDIVFSDVVMPGSMDGFSLAEWLRRQKPEVRVLLSSGHQKAASDDTLDLGDVPILLKPYRLDELDHLLRQLQQT
jgi:DNA-binding response OmpR family regulator